MADNPGNDLAFALERQAVIRLIKTLDFQRLHLVFVFLRSFLKGGAGLD